MNYELAISQHLTWRLNLRIALAERSQLDGSRVSLDHVCQLGGWLHGEAKQKYGRLSSHHFVVERHAAFHKETGHLVELLNNREYARVDALLGMGSQFSRCSNHVRIALAAFLREAGLRS